MPYNPAIHIRKRLRLKDYDYSKPNLFFVTICCQDRRHLFGHVENGVMILNDAGKMVKKWYFELENKYPDKKCHEMVVMPNHVHFILENAPPGSTTQGRPYVGDPAVVGPDDFYGIQITQSKYGMHNEKYQSNLFDAIGWFKTMTTNEYIRGVKQSNWQRFNKRVWQRSYFERIVRSDLAYFNISRYIRNNPMNWTRDRMK